MEFINPKLMFIVLLLIAAIWFWKTQIAYTTNAIAGVGTVFKRGDGTSSETFNAVSEVNSITGPTKSRGTIDVTSLDSTGGYREFIASFRDAGTVVLNMNWTRDGFDDLNDDFESDSTRNFQIVMPDTGETTFDFAAYVTDINQGIPFDDKITMDVTLKITGQVTLTS